MTVYTKTGDKGETSLLGGKRVDKDSIVMKSIGEVDELNSSIGVSVAELRQLNRFKNLVKFLQTTQSHLFKVGAELVSLDTDLIKNGTIKVVGNSQIEQLEQLIDQMESKLPKLTNFILPGGCSAAAHLHHARTICRRTERVVVNLSKQKKLRSELLIYLNRLSDFLFSSARWVNYRLREKEELVK